MSLFSGLVVCPGHDKDGMMLDCKSPHYFYREMPKVGAYLFKVGPPEPALDVYAETKCLKHIIGLRGDFEIDMWIPDDKDASWAFHQVFSSYANKDRPYDR